MTCLEYSLSKQTGNITTYTKCGEGTEVLVFIHAGGLNKEMWVPQMEYFKSESTVISYNIRGHANSTFSENESFDIEDLLAILKQEKIDKIHLIACSLGAIIGLDFSITYPDFIKSLVLVSPGLIAFQEHDTLYQQQMMEYISAIQQSDTTAMLRSLKLLTATGNKSDNLPIEIEQYIDAAFQDFLNKNNHLRAPKIKHLNPRAGLGALSFKTLILFGAQDHAYIQNNATELAASIPKAKMLEIKEAAHLLNLEQALLFNKALETFLDKN